MTFIFNTLFIFFSSKFLLTQMELTQGCNRLQCKLGPEAKKLISFLLHRLRSFDLSISPYREAFARLISKNVKCLRLHRGGGGRERALGNAANVLCIGRQIFCSLFKMFIK